ncbi:drug/metabolite transporter (DMT)-like permease [Kerstersia gyiorum]|nr:drug/metabolite transporter (DMT)-like permease [Kerstersia gyiorum]MCP1680797.1 drug/metabolite transporter (DMT)-like permease [Kerstersia gyiorum]MCP1716462.1 drug/metabolite transporter (DMT)-like permease [Kerstersia gyiorum]MCW2185163.1 drug/metabolite transporter (DMT)-like permease [Kerstersia gyiorum]
MSVVSAAWAGVGAASPAMRGILCLLCGIFFLTISDSLAKWLGGTYAPVQLLFLRGSLAVPIMLVLILALAGRPALRTRYPGLHLFRGFLNVVSASFFYYGLTQLPLAENTAIAFSAPLFVTLLSVLYLKEQVDGRRWAAVIAGFAGVMIVVQPGGPAFQPAALFPLATAFGYAVMMVSARGIGREEGLLTTMFYIALAQVIVAGAAVAWFWQPINQEIHWLGLTGMAICRRPGWA